MKIKKLVFEKDERQKCFSSKNTGLIYEIWENHDNLFLFVSDVLYHKGEIIFYGIEDNEKYLTFKEAREAAQNHFEKKALNCFGD